VSQRQCWCCAQSLLTLRFRGDVAKVKRSVTRSIHEALGAGVRINADHFFVGVDPTKPYAPTKDEEKKTTTAVIEQVRVDGDALANRLFRCRARGPQGSGRKTRRASCDGWWR
jgi:hypothetical protein